MPSRLHPPTPVPAPPSVRERNAAFVGIIFVQFCFASFPVAGKFAFEGFAPLSLATWRVIIAASIFGFAAWYRHRGELWVGWRDLALLGLLSLLGITFNQVLFIKGLSLSTATNAGLIMPVIPVATYAFALVLGREPIRPRRIFGLALACFGVGLLFVKGKGAELGGDTTAGDLMMVGNACCYGLYLVLAKPVLLRHQPLVITAWVFGFGAICVPWFAVGNPLFPANAAPAAWMALAWIIVFPTLIGYFLNLWALRQMDASIAGIFMCLQPMIAISGAVIFLGEPFTSLTAVSCGLVLAGVALVSLRMRRP
ncbi:MAG: DMT family transporter [Planctomycetota bacterium]